MKKITLSFQLMAAIIAVTILQVCAGTAAAGTCAQPTLTPAAGSGSRVSVYIETATAGASLVYTLSGSGAIGGIIRNRTGTVSVTVPIHGTTALSVVAIKSGWIDSPAKTGTYTN